MVELGDGTSTGTCSPQLENVVVTFVPVESVAISSTGSIVPLEMVSVLDTSGVELVAAVFHLRA